MGLFDWLKPAREIDRDSFAALVADLLAKGGRPGFRYHPAKFQLRDGGQICNLGNAYVRTKALPAKKRLKELELFIASVLETPSIEVPDLDTAVPLLRPTVRLRGWDELSLLGMAVDAGENAPPGYPSQMLAGDLVVRPAIDLPASLVHVTVSQLEQWNISLENALKIASANIENLLKPVHFGKLREGVFEAAWLPVYQPCLLLFPELFRHLPLLGAPVVAPVTRDRLLVCGSEDAAGLSVVLDLAEQALREEVYLCSARLYRYDGRAWTVFQPEADPSVKVRCHRVATIEQAQVYDAQKAALDERYESANEDIFVSSFMVVEGQGHTFSIASWGHDVVSLLPQADMVAIGFEEGGFKSVSWNTALADFGDLMIEEPGLVPPRWRVERSPSRDRIDRALAAD